MVADLKKSWKPIGSNVLICKDRDKDKTEGGIVLPNNSKIPVLTCRVLEIGPAVDQISCPIQKYDRILVRPQHATPVNFDQENKLFILDYQNILAVEENKESVESENTRQY